MTVLELYQMLDALYPRALSCTWDNDGLMVAEDPQRTVRRVLLALDATEEAICYAASHDCEVLLTHHPLIFRPLSSLTPLSLSGRRTLAALRGGVSVLSFHTRLDAGEGGVNDTLADVLGIRVTSSFGDGEAPTLGRIGELERETPLAAFASHVRAALGCTAVHMTGSRPARRIAIVGGDGKDMIRPAIAAGADTLLTGAVSYNTALDAAEEGLNIIEAGHYHTEAPVLARLEALCQQAGLACLTYKSNLTAVVCE